jgi:hypothetical protein
LRQPSAVLYGRRCWRSHLEKQPRWSTTASEAQGPLVCQYGGSLRPYPPSCAHASYGYQAGQLLIDINDNLVLCDWEQVDAPPTTLAPEADGTWDMFEASDRGGANQADEDGASRLQLLYEKYTGPVRQNVDEDLPVGDCSWHSWKVFPLWNTQALNF